ncbi:MAG: glycosyltransferase family 4 protein [Caldilineales bacterium]|nr:glycosyltransferase family 4 protein [Caldilineales bacterium]
MLQNAFQPVVSTMTMPMRVLMLSTEYRLNRVGGLGAHVRALLPKLGDLTEVDLYLPRFDRMWPEEEAAGSFGHVYRVDADTPGGGDYFDVNVWRMNDQVNVGISRQLDSGVHYDIVHAHDWLTGYIANDLKARYGIPLVVTFHATEHGRRDGKVHEPLSRRIHIAEEVLAQNADLIITCSEFMRSEVHEILRADLSKIMVIPNGVNMAEFTHLREERPAVEELPEAWAGSDGPLIFFVGRMVWEKGPDLLVAALSEVVHYYPTLRAVLGGTGPLTEKLRGEVQRQGLQGKVFLPGFIDDRIRDALYAVADVAVFPSRYEPFGIVALEAMASGTPVVTTTAGGLGEVVENGQTGLTVRPDNADDLAGALLRTLDAPEDAVERARRAKAHVSENYGWERIAKRTLEAYRTVALSRLD